MPKSSFEKKDEQSLLFSFLRVKYTFIPIHIPNGKTDIFGIFECIQVKFELNDRKCVKIIYMQKEIKGNIEAFLALFKSLLHITEHAASTCSHMQDYA